jgi:hypothetical protein
LGRWQSTIHCEKHQIPKLQVRATYQANRSHLVKNLYRTAIYMIWDWGWTWKNIEVVDSKIAIDASEVANAPDPNTGRYQGTGVRVFNRYHISGY